MGWVAAGDDAWTVQCVQQFAFCLVLLLVGSQFRYGAGAGVGCSSRFGQRVASRFLVFLGSPQEAWTLNGPAGTVPCKKP